MSASEDDELFLLASQQYEASIKDSDAVQYPLAHDKSVSDGYIIDLNSSDTDEDDD